MYYLYVDGASRGNPGPSAIGVVIEEEYGYVIDMWGDYIGVATNNVAEYTALIRGLKKILDLKIREVKIFSDSELLVKQLNGDYRVKDKKLKKLFEEVKELEKKFNRILYQHIPREKNTRADSLANMALNIKDRYPPILS